MTPTDNDAATTGPTEALPAPETDTPTTAFAAGDTAETADTAAASGTPYTAATAGTAETGDASGATAAATGTAAAAGIPNPYLSPGFRATPSPARPSIRWGGVVWGLLLVVFAATVLLIVSSHDRVLAAEVWFGGLSVASAWSLAAVVAGVFILILALLAAVRSAQRKRRA